MVNYFYLTFSPHKHFSSFFYLYLYTQAYAQLILVVFRASLDILNTDFTLLPKIRTIADCVCIYKTYYLKKQKHIIRFIC